MKSAGKHCICVSRLLWLLVLGLSFNALQGPAQILSGASEVRFPVLKTRTGVYTNATVTKITKSWIFVLHDNGVCNIKAEDLTPETRVALGYEKAEAKAQIAPDGFTKQGSTDKASSNHHFEGLSKLNVNVSAMTKFASNLSQRAPSQIKERLDEMSAGNPMSTYIVLGILAATHIFVSTLFWLICRKTHNAPGPLVWVPVLQLIPLLRAANMPRVWFFAYFIPVLNIIAQIVWSIKICKTRGKSPFVAFLLILPPTSVFAFLYLALSPGAPVVIKKKEIISLSFA
jgi:hypothetical protein